MEQITNVYDARRFLQQNKVMGSRRVCALTRVSTQHEQQTNALVNQNQWIVDEIGRHKDWIFDIEKDLYTDSGISGTSTNKRIEFNEMIQKAKNGEYDLIVTREVCRFMRNAKLTLTLVDELEKCGVEVFFVNDGIWSFNKDDYFKLTIMATYAEQESRKVSERVFSGQAVARLNGVQFGNGNILGYDLVKGKKSEDTTYVINEEQAVVVRKIFELAQQGYGMKKIKNYLEANGYKTSEGKKKWNISTIERILRRRTYMGEYEYLQSVTIDPLTHERININDRSLHIYKQGSFPAIIEPEVWHKVQELIDARINHNLEVATGKTTKCGVAVNKDTYCQKMRCGCGRRFKKDIGRNNSATYRCYELVDDGNKKVRSERSKILNDDCCIDGIIDWKLDLFTLQVFDYLSISLEEVRVKLLRLIEKSYTYTDEAGYCVEDKLKIEAEIKRLEDKNSRLLDALADGVISTEAYKNKKAEIEKEINTKHLRLRGMEKVEIAESEKIKTLSKVQKFIGESLKFPKVGQQIVRVPEVLIVTYVNSIKACANNVFEYNIRVNPNAKSQSPLIVPDEEYIPSVHSAVNKLDNSNAYLLGEFEVDYNMAKEYANLLGRKVVRKQWQIPVKIKIYVNL